jgi:hypothetical protein
MAARETERERQRTEAMEAAAQRRAEHIKHGRDPDFSIIEAIRDRLDLEAELVPHGYERMSDGRYPLPKVRDGRARCAYPPRE